MLRRIRSAAMKFGTIDDSRRLLQDGAWFGSLPAALQDEILDGAVIHRHRRGAILSRENSPPQALCALLEGQLHFFGRIGNGDGDGDHGLLHVGEPGLWFGEYAVLTDQPTILSVVAKSAVRVLELPKAQFDRIVNGNPLYYRHFARLALDRYAWLIKSCIELSELGPEQRLRRRLATMARLRVQERSDAVVPTLGVAQGELARMIGVSRQTLNGLLQRLAGEGLVELGFRRICIPDPGALEA